MDSSKIEEMGQALGFVDSTDTSECLWDSTPTYFKVKLLP